MPGFDCKATAAVLNSGGTLALASHVAAALATLLVMFHHGPSASIAFGALLIWCLAVYLAVRVKIDAGFFELLAGADHPPAQLDDWLKTAGLREQPLGKTMEQRRAGALRLWRALALCVTVEIVSVLSALLLSIGARPGV